MDRITARGELRELARRQDASATVVLFWRPDDDAVFVVLSDRTEPHAAMTQVAPGEALDAYWHPYVYRERPDLPQAAELHSVGAGR